MTEDEFKMRVVDFIEYDVKRQLFFVEQNCTDEQSAGYKRALEWVLHCFDNLKDQIDK